MSWFVYVIRLAERFSLAARDRILTHLREKGIGCRDYFTPIHLQPYIVDVLGTRRGQFPVTDRVSDRTIALPFYPQMTQLEVRAVVDALRAAFSEGSGT